MERDISVPSADEHVCGVGIVDIEEWVCGECPNWIGGGQLGIRFEWVRAIFGLESGVDGIDGKGAIVVGREDAGPVWRQLRLLDTTRVLMRLEFVRAGSAAIITTSSRSAVRFCV